MHIKGSSKRRLIFISGLSGAGRKTALSVFDDMGCYIVDNLPMHMMDSYLDCLPQDQTPIVIGFGARLIDFDIQKIRQKIQGYHQSYDVHFVFLKANNNIIHKRYALTGMTHPLCKDGNLEKAIQTERDIFDQLQDDFTLLIETDDIGPKTLKTKLVNILGYAPEPALVISSFGFKYGVPKEAETIFDARILKNPHWHPEISSLTGQDQAIQDFIEEDSKTEIFIQSILDYISSSVIPFMSNRQSFYHIAIGCTGGKHRSVYCAQKIYQTLHHKGTNCRIQHKMLD